MFGYYGRRDDVAERDVHGPLFSIGGGPSIVFHAQGEVHVPKWKIDGGIRQIWSVCEAMFEVCRHSRLLVRPETLPARFQTTQDCEEIH